MKRIPALFLVALLGNACGGGAPAGPAAPASLSIVGRSPAADAVDVALDASVDVEFDGALDAASIGPGSVVLRAGANVIATRLSVAGTTLTLRALATLQASTEHEIEVTTAVRDVAGRALAAPVLWRFQTRAAPIVTPPPAPTVVSTEPRAGAARTSVDTVIKATFSVPMNLASFSGAFQVMRGTEVVAGRFWVSGATANFQPTAPLAAGATYVATIRAGVRSIAGGVLETEMSWSFSTRAEVRLVSTYPAAEATDVRVSARILVTFSEPILESSLRAETALLIAGTAGGVGRPVEVRYDPNTATLRLHPTGYLARDTRYTVRFTRDVKTLDGSPLASELSFSFTTGAPVRPTVELVGRAPEAQSLGVVATPRVEATLSVPLDPFMLTIESAFLECNAARVPIDISLPMPTVLRLQPRVGLPRAGACRVWLIDVSALNGATISANWPFTVEPGSRWTQPQRLLTHGSYVVGANTPVIRFAPNGRGLLVWPGAWTRDTTVRELVVAHYAPATGVSARRTIDAGLDLVGRPLVAYAADGSALVVFARSGAFVFAWMSPAGEWTVTHESLDASGSAATHLVADDVGNALLVWRVSGGDRLRGKRFTPGGGWSGPIEVGAAGAGLSLWEPRVEMAPDGTAFALWREGSGSPTAVSVAVAPPGGVFGAPLVRRGASAGFERTWQQALGVGRDGTAFIAWVENVSSSTKRIAARSWTHADGWSGPTVLTTFSALHGNELGTFELAVDGSGGARVVWDGTGSFQPDIQTRRYTRADGWGPAQRIHDTYTEGLTAAVARPDGKDLTLWKGTSGQLLEFSFEAGAWTTPFGLFFPNGHVAAVSLPAGLAWFFWDDGSLWHSFRPW